MMCRKWRLRLAWLKNGMPPPISTPILCFVDIDNLETLMGRGVLYVPNHAPADGLPYRDFSSPRSRVRVRRSFGLVFKDG